MKSVYQAAHGVDAHMIKALLEQADIPAQVRGEYLQGALGELPVTGMVTVWVAEADAARARELVLDWERSEPAPDAGPEANEHAAPTPADDPGRSSGIAVIAGVLLVTIVCWAIVRVLG